MWGHFQIREHYTGGQLINFMKAIKTSKKCEEEEEEDCAKNCGDCAKICED